tara:strand:+ start:1548 stop:2936 length:1389 start_codon:yes stop_codon:yes gene_type:complete
MVQIKEETITSFTENLKSKCLVAYPKSIEELKEVLTFAKNNQKTICNRASGYSYGDMILNTNEIVLNLSRMDRILSWNRETGEMIVEPGAKFSDIFTKSLPDNWTLSACPGGDITVGGAVSNNVHGKDSWKSGNFGALVKDMKLLLSNGSILTLNENENVDLFYAVIGGMGLLGIILEITLTLKKIPSPFVEVSSFVSKDISETIEKIEKLRETSDFLVSWVDCFPRGKSLGRGYVTAAKWIESDVKVDSNLVSNSCKVPNRVFGIFPSGPTWFLLRPFFLPSSIKKVNKLHYLLAKMIDRKKKIMLFTDWNFMHHKIPNLKHVYRPHGFLEFQPMIPRRHGSKPIVDIIKLCQKYDSESLLCGVKLHGKDDFMISYSDDAFSLGIDIQLRNRKIEKIKEFQKELLILTTNLEGKFYLAKDEMITKDFFEAMYPKRNLFKELKEKYDKESIFSSDMYQRLFV